jgi:TetR/AcrR family transcriptional repressor of nem operon
MKRMKITRQQAEENRLSLVRAAGRLFRARGIDGVGVKELAEEAGLTHGALYAHFPSKEALAAEAMAYGSKKANEKLLTHDGIAGYLDFYLSESQRDNLMMGCPMAASASEIARQDKAVSERFTEGFLETVTALEKALGPGGNKRERALVMAAAMIGGLAVARATSKADPKLSDEILRASRKVIGEVGGPKKRVRRS